MEAVRRKNVLALLQNEYILSHNTITPALLAGTEQPPAQWINSRLKQLGEQWTVAENQQPPPVSPEVRLLERAVEAVRNCNSFRDSSFKRMQTAQDRVKRTITKPSKPFLQWQIETLNREEMQLYNEVYRQNFVEVHRLLVPKVPNAAEAGISYEGVSNMANISEICLDLSTITEAYIKQQYSEGKINLEDDRRYLGRLWAVPPGR